ncbi:uncharacterized protein TRAVEDRAFT_49366 [Trametes versicolor FP-101664 SS1]|uniref:uncharacterized protein n=1 Tax=Trametes versicolor (strain FP-101664) TaxID=717944 RepID=UPI00046227B9|nr:uncharacterized protein TRAVEDRAFT_49366 [Trametes versicolor FP-101664 SS1]EIW56541.1 hypothetical protein TRAVEDRAFT_49366 [Trametes versicolor FP-101664 SS1]
MDSTCQKQIAASAVQGLQLNNDVLLNILAFSDRETLCTLAQTCHIIHQYCSKYILQDGVFLKSKEQFVSFAHFLVGGSDWHHRIRLLHILALFINERSSAPEGQLGKLLHKLFVALASSGSLRRLSIYFSERILGWHPDLPEAIAGLHTIRYLMIVDAGPRAIRMLKALRASLLYADITMKDTVLPPEDKNPIRLLQGSQGSLRELVAKSFVGVPDTPQYPHVTTFHLGCTQKAPWTHHYVRAFPHLRHLTTQISYHHRCNLGEIEKRRARNQSEQEHFGAWPSLRSFRGSVLSLYLLGIRCPIRAVNIDTEGEALLSPAVLRAVLDDARPHRLHLCIDGGYLLADPDAGFWHTFSHPCVEAVEHFALDVRLSVVERSSLDISAALAAIAPHIVAPLRDLRSFKLTIDCSQISSGRRPLRSAEYRPLYPVEEVLAGWDMNAYANHIRRGTESSGSLQSITVCLKDHRSRGNHTVTLGSECEAEVDSSDEEDGARDD